MRWWKIFGLAGLAGVAATGAVTVRDERRRRAYAPDEIRARLHERVAALPDGDPVPGTTTATAPGTPGAEDSAPVPPGQVRRLRLAAARRLRRLRPTRPT